MFKHKKITAFILSLLISTSAVYPLYDTFAEDEADTSVSADISDDEDSGITVSGSFSYSITHDNTACIEDCSSQEKNLIIPDTIDGIPVTELGKLAFGNDFGNPYETITLPASINYISSDNPFAVCDSLKEIIVDPSNENYTSEDGILFSKDKSKLVCYPQKRSGSSYVIPEGVSVLCGSSFYNTQLSEVTFPSTLSDIQYYAMGNNSKLTSVDLSGTKISAIGMYAFTECTNLTEVLLPDTLYEIDGAAFSRCKSLKEITLPEHLEIIAQYAFIDTAISKITIPDSVTEIGYCALGYYNDAELGEKANESFVIIGSSGSAAQTYSTDSDTEYGYSNSFTFRTPEEDADLTEQLALERKTFGNYEYAVVGDGIVITACYADDAVLNVPSEIEGYKVIAVYPVAFRTCSSEEINLPETVTYIREMSFYGCANLKKLTLPSSLTEIGNNSFDSCTLLETLDTGGAVTIGEQVFLNCTALKNLTISGNCTSIGTENEEPFLDCSALESVTVTDGDGIYSSDNGVLYNKDKSTVILYPQAKTDKKYTAPNSVKEIGQSAFYRCKYLESVDISKVEKINAYAFEGCEKLKKAKLSKNLTGIGADAFFDCKELTSLRFYDKLTDIGEGAFGECYNENADTENGESETSLIEGFKIYADKDSIAYQYAESKGIKILSNTIYFLGLNIHKGILFGSAGVIAAAIAALIAKFAISKSAKKKNENIKEKDKNDEK